MKKKKLITVFKEDDIQYKIPDNPKQFLEFFSDIFKKIPEKYLDDATIDLSGDEVYNGSYVVSLEVYYLRPETDEEFAEREANEKAQEESVRLLELEQLKKLKEKYE